MDSGGVIVASSQLPDMLANRAKTAAAVSLLLHLCLLYGLEIAWALHRAIFHLGILDFNFFAVLKHPVVFLFRLFFSFGWIVLVTVVIGLSWMNYKKAEWFPKAKSRKEILTERYHNVKYAIFHFSLGILLGISYLKFSPLKEYFNYSDPEKPDSLDDRRTTVMLSCGVTACFYFTQCAKNREYLIRFPPLVTPVSIRLRGIFLPTLKHAVSIMTNGVLWGFLVSVNVLFGGIFRKLWSLGTFAKDLDRGESQMRGFRYLDEIQFLVLTFCCQALVIFTLRSVWLCMEVLITKRVKFRIEEFPGITGASLQDFLVSNDPYLQRLAFYDLKLLTEFDTPKAVSLFALSHPGGYPKIWDTVRNACLNRIHNLTKNIRNYLEEQETEKRNKESKATGLSANYTSPRAEFCSTTLVSPTSGDSGRLRFKMSMRHLRTGPPAGPESQQKGHDVLWENPFSSVVQLTNLIGSQLKSQALTVLQSFNLLRYLESASSSEVIKILDDKELTLWAASALADIIVLSCTSDKNGVVQQHLCKIITALVELCDALEELKNGRSNGTGENGSSSLSCKKSLDGPVKSAIKLFSKPLLHELKRVHNTFEPYYEIICISPACEKTVRQLVLRD